MYHPSVKEEALVALDKAHERSDAPICFNAAEQETLNQSIRTMLQKAFQAGFEKGVAYERSTI